MIGKFLGQVAKTAIKVANLPMEAADRTLDFVYGEDTDDMKLANPGKQLAEEVESLLSTIDD